MKLNSLLLLGLIFFSLCSEEKPEDIPSQPNWGTGEGCAIKTPLSDSFLHDVQYLSSDIESDCFKFYYEPNFKGNVTQICGSIYSFVDYVPVYRSFRASPNAIFALFEQEGFAGKHIYAGKGKAITEMAEINADDNKIAPYLKSIKLIREECFYLGMVIDNEEVKREICDDVEHFQIGKLNNAIFFVRHRPPPLNRTFLNFLSDVDESNTIFGKVVNIPKSVLKTLERFDTGIELFRAQVMDRRSPYGRHELVGYAERPLPFGNRIRSKSKATTDRMKQLQREDEIIDTIPDGEVPLMIAEGIPVDKVERVYAEIPSNRLKVVFYKEINFQGESFTGSGDYNIIDLSSIKSLKVQYHYEAHNFLCKYEAGTREIIRKERDEIECFSFDGFNCFKKPMKFAVCAEFVHKNYSKMKPLRCGPEYLVKFGSTGYDIRGHWCRRGKKYYDD